MNICWDVFLPEVDPGPHAITQAITRACAFPDTGFISLHTSPAHPDQALALVVRYSRYGSISHQHADQGSFALLSGGTALISPSGYLGRSFGTAHHFGWTRRTKAHNTILVDGAGQIAEDKTDNGPEDLRYTAAGRMTAGLGYFCDFLKEDAE